jgi:uncharacterized protein (DUF2236 family)
MPSASPQDLITLPGLREAIRTAGTLVAKSVSSLSAADTGYFGPGSVSWRIFSHAGYAASGIAAALVQALHPTTMAAVDEHSAYRLDAWRRAHLTADYILTVTFSSRTIADLAARRVRSIHRQVAGTDPVTGRRYRADDPDLLLWIHCVHTENALLGYERFGVSLRPGEADRFVREQRVAAGLVGLEPSAVPATRDALRAVIAATEGLVVTEPARQFTGMLLRARMPITMRGFWALHVVAAVALLPDWIVSAYGLPGWLPKGRFARVLAQAAFGTLNIGFLLFRPVREARAKLREMERLAGGGG